MFFFISQNIYCFKKTSNYSDDIFSFVEYVDRRTMRKVLNSLTQFSIFVLSYRNLAVYLNWMTEVCVCVCLWACIDRYVHEWLTWRVVLPIELTQCYRSGKAESHFVKEEKVTACNYLIQCISSFLLYRTTVPLQGTFANIFSPNILRM